LENIEIIYARLRRILDDLNEVEKLSRDSRLYGLERSTTHIKSHLQVLLESLTEKSQAEAGG